MGLLRIPGLILERRRNENRKRGRLVSFALVWLALLVPADSPALANRVFVSARSGNDANSCDNIGTPCQTLSGAVTQLNPGGEAIVLDSGGYGPVTITKALTIEAPPGVLAFIHPPSGNAVTINAGASDNIVLRGLTMNVGSGMGIQVNTVGSLHIESCVINGFATGISFSSTGALFLKDSTIRGCAGDGVTLAPSIGTLIASVDHCRFKQNGLAGLDVQDGSQATVRNSVTAANKYGFEAAIVSQADTAELSVEECLVAANTTYGVVAVNSGATARVSTSMVTGNGIGLKGLGGDCLSRVDNTIEANTTDLSGTGTYAAK